MLGVEVRRVTHDIYNRSDTADNRTSYAHEDPRDTSRSPADPARRGSALEVIRRPGCAPWADAFDLLADRFVHGVAVATIAEGTASEASAFLDAVGGDRHAAIYDLALNTGMRRGELAGLRWADVHDDYLTVRNSRVPVDYVVHEGTPKSKKGRRVDLDPDTVAMLRRWRARQLEERLYLGAAWTDTGYVFTNELGQPLHPGTISWHFKRLVKLAGVPVIRLHDVRHTHATLGLAAGVPLKVMSERLGHATTQITADLYQHVIPGMGADAAQKIAKLIRRKTG